MVWKGWKPAPLPASFMFTAIIGFIISAIWVFPRSFNWGLAFLIFFTLMFIASVISMTRAPSEAGWALDKKYRVKRKKR